MDLKGPMVGKRGTSVIFPTIKIQFKKKSLWKDLSITIFVQSILPRLNTSDLSQNGIYFYLTRSSDIGSL